MLLNCGIEEDSWESLGLQGDPTSPSERTYVLNIHWKNWCCSWIQLQHFGHLMWRTDSLEKDLDAGKDWRQEEKGTTEDEMVWWHYPLDGHEFEQALGIGDGHWHAAVRGITQSRTRLSDWTVWLWELVLHRPMQKSFKSKDPWNC